MCLLSRKQIFSETGIFVIEKDAPKPLDVLPKGGSFNDIAESLGYPEPTYRGVFTYNSNKILFMGFSYSKKLLFVVSKDDIKSLSQKEIWDTMLNIDWKFEDKLLISN